MSTSEISLLVIAVLPVLYRAWIGWRHGASTEVRHLLVNLFGVLVAVRFWQPWTQTISTGLTFDPRWIALSSFVLLYALGSAVAGFTVRLKSEVYQSVKPDPVNRGLGLLFGGFTGALLGACLLWLAMIALPGKFDAVPLAGSLAGWPRAIVRSIETNIAGVAPDSTGRTKYPQVTVAEMPVDGSAATATGGAVLMQQRGRVTWQ
jgi:uncharacterized membrane protein required for colicin V production